MKVIDVKHAWIKDDLLIDRPDGLEDMYLFLHFWNPMQLVLNGETVFTQPNACVIYAPGERQFATAEGEWQHDWLIISSEVGSLFEKFGIVSQKVYYPKNHEFITETVHKLEIEHTSRDEYSDAICKCLITELVTIFARETNEDENKSKRALNGQTKFSLERLRNILRVNYMKKWDLENMADYVNLSASYLSSAYKKLYGVSPVQDLINIRVMQAKTMLTESHRSIKDISEWLGYSHPSHFIRQFTKNVGISPLKYRQNNMLQHRNDFVLPKGI